MGKLNIWPIIQGHVDTFRDFSTGRRSPSDLLIFFGSPLIVVVAGWHYHWGFSANALNALLAAFAIFAGLLLNLLLLVYTSSADGAEQNFLSKFKSRFIREVHSNIAFSVLLASAVVVVALIGVIRIKVSAPAAPETGELLTAALIYLTVNFGLTLLMILKRMHAMINEKLNAPAIRKAS